MAHQHPSVTALLEAEKCVDPFVAIRRRARALVARAFEIGWEGPPFDMTQLASLQGLEVIASDRFADDQDACIVPGRVLVNARRHPVRQRYSVAHEVAHTLFPDYEEELRRAGGRLWRRGGDESEFERLCQAAAAELLLPLQPFLTGRARHNRGLDGVVRLAGEFETSIEAAARRWVDTSEEPVAALLLRPRDITTGEWHKVNASDGHIPRLPLCVSVVCYNEAGAGFRAAKGCAPQKGSASDRAWKRVSLANRSVLIVRSEAESWAHAGVEGVWHSEAVTLPKGSPVPYEVLCIVRPQSD